MKKIKDLILETKKIKWVDILDLQPIDLKNDYHSQKTKQSIIENGFSRAIYVWLNPEDQQTYIIDGHLRTDLLKELVSDGYDVPDMLNCTFLDLPDKPTAIRYLLQVFNQKTNPISQKALGDWFEELDLSIPELNLEIDDLHIELDDIPPIIETEGDDDVTESAPPITRRGDVYELGGVHRVMCGDSTSIDDVEELMAQEKADMVFTDPPYGVSYQSNRRTKSQKFDLLKNDNEFISEWINHLPLINKGFVFIWTSWKVLMEWIELTKPLGKMSNMIIWDKGGGGIGDLEKTFPTDYEIALVWHNENQIKGKRIGSVWDCGKDNPSDYLHPTQKPVNLAETAILSVTQNLQIVTDLFLGSGSTLIACEKTNRKCYGMELDEKYCDVIIKRYVDFCQKNNREYSVFLNGKVCKEFEDD